MTKEETKQFLMEVIAIYPDFKTTKKTVGIWKKITNFAYYDDMIESLYEYAKNETYPPTIAGILKYWRSKNYETILVSKRND